jgi:hypothetical protein
MRILAALTICSLILSVFLPAPVAGWDIDLTIKGEVLSARLAGIPLKAVLEKLERERGIWFKGNSSLLDETITVQFADLPIEEGLNRILASMNYSLVFDRNERLVGVIVVARGAVDRPASEVRTDRSMRTTTSSAVSERTSVNRPVTKSGNNNPQGGYIKGIKEDREDFTVIRNCPPPGGPVEVTPGDRERFGAVKNCPPPGGPFKVRGEELKNFEVIRDSGPPGGPVKVTAEERENFKVIENCPPPGN